MNKRNTFTAQQIAELRAAFERKTMIREFQFDCLNSIIAECTPAALTQLVNANIRHVSTAAKKFQNNS